MLLRAFEALRGAGVQARLTVAGATAEEVEPLLLEPEGVELAGPWTTPRSGGCSARRTCSARPRLAARASAWCSPRRSPRARPSWPPTSLATATWSRHGVGQRAGTRAATPWSSARRCARSPSTPTGACGWPRPRASARSASPGRTWPARSPRSTSRRSRCRSPSRRMTRVAARAGIVPAEPGPRVGRERLPVARAEGAPERPAQAAARTARRVLVAAGAVARRGPRRARAAAPRDRVDRRALVAATPGLGARGLRADVRLDARPRRGVERDPARRPARHARPPPRHRPRQR